MAQGEPPILRSGVVMPPVAVGAGAIRAVPTAPVGNNWLLAT